MRIFSLLFVLFAGSQAYSFDNAIYLSVMPGFGQVFTDVGGVSYESSFNLGFRGGIELNEQWTAGIFYIKSDNTSNTTVRKNNFSYEYTTDFNPLMAEFTYHLDGYRNEGFFVSGLVGIVSIVASDGSATPLGVGANVGYTFMMGSDITFSPQIVMVRSMGSDYEGGVLLSALANFSIWF